MSDPVADMQAAARAALPSVEWHEDDVVFAPDAEGNYRHLAYFVTPEVLAHIVASQPRAVLAVLDERDRLRAEVERLNGILNLHVDVLVRQASLAAMPAEPAGDEERGG